MFYLSVGSVYCIGMSFLLCSIMILLMLCVWSVWCSVLVFVICLF